MQSDVQKHYGENMIGRMSLEQFDQEISQHLEQVFKPFPALPLFSRQRSTQQDDLVDQMLFSRQRSSNVNQARISRPSCTNSSVNGDLFKTENYMINNTDLPFELTKEQLDKFYFNEFEESTHDS